MAERGRVKITVDADEIGRALTLLAFFTCAIADGDREQRQRIKDEALPMMRDHSNPMSWVVERVFDIMGEGWNPTKVEGGHGEWLNKLLAERRERKS